MTRFLLLIFILTIITSCSRNICGTYKHRICLIGPNCFIMSFDKDSSFEYKYFQDILGSGTLKGKYSLNKDTIQLFVAKDSLEKEPYFKTFATSDSNLYIKVITAFGNKEQESYGGQIILNDTIKLILDLKGQATFKKIQVKTIKVNLAMNETLRDSIFKINTKDNNIEIHTSVIPMMEAWIPKLYLKKGNKIYPLQFETEMVLLGKNDYYKKVY